VWRWQNSDVSLVQAAFRGIEVTDWQKCVEHLCCIIDKEAWRGSKASDGIRIETFAQWVTCAQPAGLGVSTQKSAEILRKLLLDSCRVAQWAAVLERIYVKPGRPPKNLVAGDGFPRFYSAITAGNGIDRRLLHLLNKKPEFFALVVDGTLTLAEAEQRAGWTRKRLMPRCLADLSAVFDKLTPSAQFELLDLLWERTSQIARETFLQDRNA
jgi:hypothetical protein